jgi:hypothetical protein
MTVLYGEGGYLKFEGDDVIIFCTSDIHKGPQKVASQKTNNLLAALKTPTYSIDCPIEACQRSLIFSKLSFENH